MTFNPGTRLGAYEILSLLGAGGMGEVYRARDSKLGREIAIKVLPEAFTRDPERLARFEREARLLASLNHPNIGGIYGLEESNGTRFLVLELVPGETLADLISPYSRDPAQRGADRPSGRVGEWESGRVSRDFETDAALRVCLQIAEAVEAAHEKGIIHRDLKPANVKVTPEGKVKVLDFGLAKAFAPDESSPSISLSPTLTLQSLREGVILGTAAYMSPEQARGKPLDKRTDIWSFGCVLYECLAGRRAFTGETVTDIIAAIVKNDPEWALLPATTPPNIQLLLRRCLQKDRNIRLHDIADARIEIDEALKAPSPALHLSPSPAPPKPGSVRLWMAVSALLAMTVVALALAVVYLSRPGEEAGPIRSHILPPEKSSFFSIGGIGVGPVAISPNGRSITFGALTEGKRQLWIRPLDALAAQPLAGTEDASYPFWSADSQYIGFFTGGKLKKINASGGPAQTLCDAPIGRGGTWNRDGTILFAPNAAGSLYRVSAAGGAASAITKVNESRGERAHRFPCFLPDGRHFLYIDTASRVGGESDNIHLASLDSKEDKLLLNAQSNAIYARGYLLFLRETSLMAQPFDAKGLKITADAFPIAEQVQSDSLSTQKAVFSASENGILAYQTAGGQSGTQLAWFDRTGKQTDAIKEVGAYSSPKLSANGQKLAVQITDPQTRNTDVWLHDLSRGLKTRFTFSPSLNGPAIWSPDGSRIAFASGHTARGIYQKASDISGKEELLVPSEDVGKIPTDWSSDGRFITYFCSDPKGKTKYDIWILPLFGDRKPFPFLQTEFNEMFASFSPDGKRIAYTSDESTKREIYVASFPGPGGKRQISTAGGQFPRWRRDGKELFYLSEDDKMMAAEVKTDGTAFEVGVVRPLFAAHPHRGLDLIYDVSADGQRFIINTYVSEQGGSPITLVTNWTAALKR